MGGRGRRSDEFVVDRNSHRVFVRDSDWNMTDRDSVAPRIWRVGWSRDRQHRKITCSRVCQYGLRDGVRVTLHGHIVLSPALGQKRSE